MFPLSNVSIKRKQMFIIMLTSTAALILACAAFVTYELVTFRQEMKRNLQGLAARIADLNTGYITFLDKESSRKSLHDILQDESGVVSAQIFDSHGKIFAHFSRSPGKYLPQATAPEFGFAFGDDRLTYAAPIELSGETIGSVVITSDLQRLYDRLARYGGIVFAVLTLSTILAFFLSSRLQRVVSDPILRLVDTAKKITSEKNYSVRAEKQGNDELGNLIDNFNGMLAQIQMRDAALQKANDELEKRVEARTCDLQAQITERIRAEEAARESEIKFQSVVQSANDAIIASDCDGSIISWNKGAEQVFGFTFDEVSGRPLSNLISRSFQANDSTPSFLLAEESEIIGKTVEMQGIRKDGNKFPLELSLAAWTTSEGRFFSAIIRDITERKLSERTAEKQLARISLLNQITHAISERHDLNSILRVVLRQLEDHLPLELGGMFLYDAEQREFTVAALRLKNIPGSPVMDLKEKTRFRITETGFGQCVEGKTLHLTEAAGLTEPALKKIADAGFNSIVAVPLLVQRELFGILLGARIAKNGFSAGDCEFFRMLSEHVALAAHQAKLHTELREAYDELRQTQATVMQQERLKALGKMASGIAHDVNNALSPIVVFSELVLRNEPDLRADSIRHLNHIKTAGEDIAHIVARMREFYRKRDEADSHSIIQINEVVQQVGELTRPRWRDIPQQRGIVVKLHTELDPNMPPIVANPAEIREALTNLILNSVEAMPQGGKLEIRTIAKNLEAEMGVGTGLGHVILEVVDSGLGMDEETRVRCLEPFFTTKGQRGTGLGLAMVYGIMERHEGTIEVESAPGLGTTVRLIFPVRQLIPSKLQVINQDAMLSAIRILCIDDEPLLRELLKEMLELDGHTVALADDGQSGIDSFRAAALKNEPFDLVITDLGMPHVDGRQVAANLKKDWPELPIILLTGWGTMMKDAGDFPSQVDAVMSKPPRFNELRQMIIKLTQR